ncbi:MAG: hypothetical protein WC971_10585 [Coriobacteriia bacterium]
MGLVVIHSGVDTLEASFRGHLSDELQERLELGKGEAQLRSVPHRFDVAGIPFVINPAGLKPWRYVLSNEDLHLRLSPEHRLPTVSARLLTEGLASYGHEGGYAMAANLAASLGAGDPRGLSRLDLFADWQGWVPSMAEMEHVVCPAQYRGTHRSGQGMTYQFGRGGTVVRVYNKTAELAVSGKDWLRMAWARDERYDPDADVWRFEVQYRRPALRRFDSERAEDAFARLGGLLASGLEWCELRVPHGLSSDRWETDPRWRAIAEGSFAGEPLERVPEIRNTAQLHKLIPMLAGLTVSGAARLREPDFDIAWGLLGDHVWAYLEREDICFALQVEQRQRRFMGSGGSRK